MRIRLNKGRPALEEVCLALEAASGGRLSASFRSFLRGNDGAIPEANIFRISDKNESAVNWFIPVTEILKERTFIENIPERAYPVAWAEGGNYVFIDEDSDGAVFFWDHEAPENIVKLAASFDTFLDLLEPFDINKIQLKPGQVKSAWIDPELLKGLKK